MLILLQVMQLIAWWEIWKVKPSLAVSFFSPSKHCPFLLIIQQIVCSAFMNEPHHSSSFLWIKIYGSMPV